MEKCKAGMFWVNEIFRVATKSQSEKLARQKTNDA